MQTAKEINRITETNKYIAMTETETESESEAECWLWRISGGSHITTH